MPLFTNEEIISNTPLPVDGSGVTQPVSGTVTANVGTTGGLALDATLTGGTQKTRITDGTNNLTITAASAAKVDGSAVTQPISAASLPLPTGAATAALQTQPGVDIGDVTINNASGAAAVNIQDGGNSITVDGTVAISGSVAVTGPLTDTQLRATPVPVSFAGSTLTTTATVTSVSVSTTVATLSASNSAKTAVVVFNEAGTLFVKLGSGATSASYTYRLTANTALEINGYAGIVTAIKASGTSAALVTEVGI